MRSRWDQEFHDVVNAFAPGALGPTMAFNGALPVLKLSERSVRTLRQGLSVALTPAQVQSLRDQLNGLDDHDGSSADPMFGPAVGALGGLLIGGALIAVTITTDLTIAEGVAVGVAFVIAGVGGTIVGSLGQEDDESEGEDDGDEQGGDDDDGGGSEDGGGGAWETGEDIPLY